MEKSIKSKTCDDRLPRRAKLSASLLTTPFVSLNWISSCATLSPISGICFSSSALAVLTFIRMVTDAQVQGMSRHLSKMKMLILLQFLGFGWSNVNKLLMCQHDYIQNPLMTFMCVYKATQIEIPCKTDLYLHEAKTLRLNSNFDQNWINLEFMGGTV